MSIIAVALCLIAVNPWIHPPTVNVQEDQSDSLLTKEHCKLVKKAVGDFLGAADYFFKEVEKYKEEGAGKKSDGSFESAVKFSELAENYSTVFSVWCKK
ncbi:MAG: hypothetical protein VYA53_02815 [Acidobacteriota bacterium]|nr:hypothetical protein [Acidobacteriota bacterium]